MNNNIYDSEIIFQLYVGPKIENLKIFANLNFIFIKTNFIKKNNLCSDFWQWTISDQWFSNIQLLSAEWWIICLKYNKDKSHTIKQPTKKYIASTSQNVGKTRTSPYKFDDFLTTNFSLTSARLFVLNILKRFAP